MCMRVERVAAPRTIECCYKQVFRMPNSVWYTAVRGHPMLKNGWIIASGIAEQPETGDLITGGFVYSWRRPRAISLPASYAAYAVGVQAYSKLVVASLAIYVPNCDAVWSRRNSTVEALEFGDIAQLPLPEHILNSWRDS